MININITEEQLYLCLLCLDVWILNKDIVYTGIDNALAKKYRGGLITTSAWQHYFLSIIMKCAYVCTHTHTINKVIIRLSWWNTHTINIKGEQLYFSVCYVLTYGYSIKFRKYIFSSVLYIEKYGVIYSFCKNVWRVAV